MGRMKDRYFKEINEVNDNDHAHVDDDKGYEEYLKQVEKARVLAEEFILMKYNFSTFILPILFNRFIRLC